MVTNTGTGAMLLALGIVGAIVARDRAVQLFIDSRKLTADVRTHLGDGVSIAAPESFGAALDALGEAGKRVQVASAAAPAWVTARLRAAGAGACVSCNILKS